jgi:5-methylcytosine-specific restriction endonuclease McrA
MSAIADLIKLNRVAKPLSWDEGLKILERDHFRCQYCGLDGLASFENSLIMTVDFVKPRARGGKKEGRNLVTACRPCNVLKGHRVFTTIEEARTHVLKRREGLKKDWEAKVGASRGSTAGAF